MLGPRRSHVAHLRMGRACAQALNESLKPLSVTLGFDLHTSVEQVPYSPAQTELRRLLKHKPSVEHALDYAGDNGVE